MNETAANAEYIPQYVPLEAQHLVYHGHEFKFPIGMGFNYGSQHGRVVGYEWENSTANGVFTRDERYIIQLDETRERTLIAAGDIGINPLKLKVWLINKKPVI